MHQIIYTSAATAQANINSMTSIAQHAAHNNETLNITGLLMMCDNVIFQVLEGERADIDMIYNRITRDPRHNGILLLLSRQISKREFAVWSTGVAKLSSENTGVIFNLTKGSLAAAMPQKPSPELTTLVNTFKNVTRL